MKTYKFYLKYLTMIYPAVPHRYSPESMVAAFEGPGKLSTEEANAGLRQSFEKQEVWFTNGTFEDGSLWLPGHWLDYIKVQAALWVRRKLFDGQRAKTIFREIVDNLEKKL